MESPPPPPTRPLNQQIHRAAHHVTLLDESHGIFCELIEAQIVLAALQQGGGDLQANVGKLDDFRQAQAVRALHSVQFQTDTHHTHEIAVEVDNATSQSLRIRWLDERGNHHPTTHQWTVHPQSSWVQWCHPGALFLVSLVLENDDEECLMAAYRPCKPLPSGCSQTLLILQDEASEQHKQQSLLPLNEQVASPADNMDLPFFVEAILTDPRDGLMVAAAALDPVGGTAARQPHHCVNSTIHALVQIVNNLLQHPSEPKYQTLKLSNRRIQHQIVASWGAMHLLHMIGFDQRTMVVVSDNGGDNQNKHEDCLVLSLPPDLELLQSALTLLELCKSRAAPHFVAELVPPVPWQAPILLGGGGDRWTSSNSGTHFVTPDERWARSDRVNRLRQGGAGRIPAPGEAPSSRGNWGR